MKLAQAFEQSFDNQVFADFPNTMRITRLFVDHPFTSEQPVSLSEAQAHYLMNVLRKALGDPVHLFNGRDGEWRSVIDRITRRRCSIALEEQVVEQKPEPDLWLIFAPIKWARIDFVASKATELGVSDIIPVFTEFTDVTRVNTQRLRANAIEAAEQCGRQSVPEVDEPANLLAVLKDWPEDRRLLYYDETGGGTGINQVLTNLKAAGQAEPMAFLIGPEGGFSRSELDLLKEKTTF